jgi:hypothetical protein
MSKYYRVNGTYVGGSVFGQGFETKKDAMNWARKTINDELVLTDTVEMLEYKVSRVAFRTIKKKKS